MRPAPNVKFLGVALTPPSVAGLLRTLGFLLLMVAIVEITDSLTRTAWSSEGSIALIVGSFSGFLLNECGVSFAKHGWRTLALLMAYSSFVFAAASFVV